MDTLLNFLSVLLKSGPVVARKASPWLLKPLR